MSWKLIACFSRGPDLPRLGIGRADSGEWLVDTGMGKLVAIDQYRGIQAALPLLESDYPTVISHIKKGLSDLGLDDRLVDTFPISALIAEGLSFPTARWPSDALRWAEQIENPDSHIISALRRLRSSGTQQQRHTAQRILYKSTGTGE
ncbi:MAG: hypothetical protein ABL967_05015 [Bryobacteraceae bacterium]